jgi:hypothetical protein
MRLDDELVYQEKKRGLYDFFEHTANDIIQDFMVFCHMAVYNDLLLKGWDWALLSKFGHLLNDRFGKTDAREKYGRENIFLGMLGGRSLRLIPKSCTRFDTQARMTICKAAELQKWTKNVATLLSNVSNIGDVSMFVFAS